MSGMIREVVYYLSF